MIIKIKKTIVFIRKYKIKTAIRLIYYGFINQLPQSIGRPINFYRLNRIKTRIYKCIKDNVDSFELEKSQETYDSNKGVIWVCWLQGEEKMPEICKICLNALRSHTNGHEIIVLTSENYIHYCTIPSYIVDRYKDGKIEHAHFADILRTCLLYEKGGCWIDATLLSTRALPEVLFTSEFYSCKFPPKRYFIEDGRWQNYFLCATPKSPMFQFVRMCFFEYLNLNIPFIDYFLMNYFMSIGYDKVPEIRHSVDVVPYNNQETWDLESLLNQPCSKEEFDRILKSETYMFKLSYKNQLFEEINGQQTLYGRIKQEFGTTYQKS